MPRAAQATYAYERYSGERMNQAPPSLPNAWAAVWAKTDREGGSGRWHPLVLHLIDVAACADAILEREPESTRARMGEILGLDWAEARGWLLFLVACHDLGKACPGFQSKWPQLLPSTGLGLPRSPNVRVHHGFVSQIALAGLLRSVGWPAELSDLVADAVGCHHGERASENAKDQAGLEIHVGRGERLEAVRQDWDKVRSDLTAVLRAVFRPGAPPTKPTLSGPDFMLLAGLTSFADWIGSNEDWFTFGQPGDCDDLPAWYIRRRAVAGQALQGIGWNPRTPLAHESESFESIFGYQSRPLQEAVAIAVAEIGGPAVLLVEAPMGEGKTEAAFFAHLELQRRFGHRGMYVALPTKATGNAMFDRTLTFLQSRGSGRFLDLQLLHGAKILNDNFQHLRFSRIYDDSAGGEVRAGEWFTNKKRALLSEYGVGTMDQALVPILPVRHNFVRLWGLANRVVVLDEIHAYDGYTGTLMLHMIRWLQAMGSSVILLSATLSPAIRRSLARATGSRLPDNEEPYPRVSIFRQGEVVVQRHFEADPDRRQPVALRGVSPALAAIRDVLTEQLSGGGMGLALVNTVQRAQDLYRLFPDGRPLLRDGRPVGKVLADDTRVLLFHARFPGEDRQAREKEVLELFGPGSKREGCCILIATQVAEQSLDLDFDVMVTDLAPIDLVLQRAGRLWRHKRKRRPLSSAALFVAGLDGTEPPSFGKPLWWGKVYREDLLLRTWVLVRRRTTLTLPDDIDSMVAAVYEEAIEAEEGWADRLARAVELADGEGLSQRGSANQAVIGFPDDGSWNDPARFVLYDEDAPNAHRTLMAQTRLGQDSAVVIPIVPEDHFEREAVPDGPQSKRLFLRALSLSRPDVILKLRGLGVPSGWEKSPLLRGCFPLTLTAAGWWEVAPSVRLDRDLGVVYEKEGE
ncbi:MAG: CRISPR-associated helicase Cas3' [Gemmatimonadota bacterium]